MRHSSARRREASDPSPRLRADEVRAPHARAHADVARELAGDPANGLSEADAEARLTRFGPNRLGRVRRAAYTGIVIARMPSARRDQIRGDAQAERLSADRHCCAT